MHVHVEGNLLESVLYFHHVDSGVAIDVIWLGAVDLFLLTIWLCLVCTIPLSFLILLKNVVFFSLTSLQHNHLLICMLLHLGNFWLFTYDWIYAFQLECHRPDDEVAFLSGTHDGVSFNSYVTNAD